MYVAFILLQFQPYSEHLIHVDLIIRRLFGIERQLYLGGVIPPHLLTRIVTIFLETGLIYTLSVVASLGVYFTGSNLEFVAALAVGSFSCTADSILMCTFLDDTHRCKLHAGVYG